MFWKDLKIKVTKGELIISNHVETADWYLLGVGGARGATHTHWLGLTQLQFTGKSLSRHQDLHWSQRILAPLLESTIEMKILWTEIRYVKSAARLLDRNCVNKGGLDLSKEVLWVSVGQRTVDLQAVKVWGQQKILPIGPAQVKRVRTGPFSKIFLLTSKFDSL